MNRAHEQLVADLDWAIENAEVAVSGTDRQERFRALQENQPLKFLEMYNKLRPAADKIPAVLATPPVATLAPAVPLEDEGTRRLLETGEKWLREHGDAEA